MTWLADSLRRWCLPKGYRSPLREDAAFPVVISDGLVLAGGVVRLGRAFFVGYRDESGAPGLVRLGSDR